MRFAVRLTPLLSLAVAGCGFAEKPYADDPLLRGGRAVWLSRDPSPPDPPPTPQLLEPPQPPLVPTSPQWE